MVFWFKTEISGPVSHLVSSLTLSCHNNYSSCHWRYVIESGVSRLVRWLRCLTRLLDKKIAVLKRENKLNKKGEKLRNPQQNTQAYILLQKQFRWSPEVLYKSVHFDFWYIAMFKVFILYHISASLLILSVKSEVRLFFIVARFFCHINVHLVFRMKTQDVCQPWAAGRLNGLSVG